MKAKYFFIPTLLFIACGTSDQPESDLNSFTDSRDGQVYALYTDQAGKKWFLDDLNHADGASLVQPDGDGFFSMYSWNKAMNACPPGFRLPTRGDYKRLIDQYPDGPDEGIDNTTEAYEGMVANGDFKLNLRGMFVNSASGVGDPENKGVGEFGYYWSSTVGDNDKPFALRIDSRREVVYLQNYDKRGMGSCRCVQE